MWGEGSLQEGLSKARTTPTVKLEAGISDGRGDVGTCGDHSLGKRNATIIIKLHLGEGIMSGSPWVSPERGLYIACCISWDSNHLDFTALLDSGASDSLLDKRMYYNIPESIRPALTDQSSIKITMADGSSQCCLGRVSLMVSIGKYSHLISFLVGSWSDSAIIGMKDLQKMNVQINFEKLSVLMGEEHVPLVDCYSNPIVRQVVVPWNTTLKGRSCTRLAGTVEGPRSTHWGSSPTFLEPALCLRETAGVITLPAMYQDPGDDIQVILENPSDDDVTLEAGTAVGSLHSLVGEELVWFGEESTGEEALARSLSREKLPLSVQEDLQKLPEHLHSLYVDSIENLDSSQRVNLLQLLREYQDIFSRDNFDIGCTDKIVF